MNKPTKLENPYLVIWFKGHLRFIKKYNETFFLLNEGITKDKGSSPPEIAYYYTNAGNYGAFYITQPYMDKVTYKYFASTMDSKKVLVTKKLPPNKVPEVFRTQILLLGV